MLELKQIVKDYPVANTVVRALKGVDLQFRSSEFVSILGPSGCGKTTLLNIIGGLDKYTTGDLVIDGVSTKDYKDRDWDTYRNHSIGFVFQSYNLIPHQSILQNVELALTLAGVPKGERKSRAEKALQRVGLGDHIHKRPNQLSGGQMQRVAIARALVNDPKIILADEPTGALDTETGIQIMELLKEMSQDRLVIMVTHNPELAEKYSSRIIRILDGEIVGDSAPLTQADLLREKFLEINHDDDQTTQTAAQPSAKGAKKARKKAKKRSSMSFWTAFKLSLNNLFTKKGRTVLTSFAGSIGIIGIALILSVSQGMTNYIDMVEQQTLTTYPLTIQSTSMDLSSLAASIMTQDAETINADGKVYQRSIVQNVAKMVKATNNNTNDLKSFKKFLEQEVAKEDSKLHSAVAGLQYSYNLDLLVYMKNPHPAEGESAIQPSDPAILVQKVVTRLLKDDMQSALGGYFNSLSNFSLNVWQELLPGLNGEPVNDVLKDQYDLVEGEWPDNYDEIVLVLNDNNELSDIALYTLGFIGDDYIQKIYDAIDNDKELDASELAHSWSYQEICDSVCRVILNSDCYYKAGDVWLDKRDNPTLLNNLYDSALPLKITGIIRPNPDATAHMLTGAVAYTSQLAEYVVQRSEQSEVIKEQRKNPDIDVFTGLPFTTVKNSWDNQTKAQAFLENYNSLPYTATEANAPSREETYLDIQCYEHPEQIKAFADIFIQGVEKDPSSFRLMIDMMADQMAQEIGISADALRSLVGQMQDEQLVSFAATQAESVGRMQYRQACQRTLSNDEATRHATIDAAVAQRGDETDEQYQTRLATYYDETVTEFSTSSYEENLRLMGYVDLDDPTAVNIYASSFEAKDIIAEEIDRYNEEVITDESQKIEYTDLVALVMSAVTTIVNAVTYVLVAFVAISLVVSSIMIGVITLISVQERTKEIGILRAIGASKRDVSSMFNAETIIIGFAAGLIGVLFTYILCLPINLILHALTHINTLNAVLPPLAALILVAISVLLTLFAGFIPSRSAAKKDPVVALRTE